MSHNQIIIYLLKNGVQAKFNTSAEKINNDPEIHIGFSPKNITLPKWLSFFQDNTIKDLKDKIKGCKNSYLKSIVLVQSKDRTFAILFGQHASSFLENKDIFEDDFGMKTAFQLIDPNKVTGIKYLDIARLHLRKTVKSTKNVKKIIDESERADIFVEEISGKAPVNDFLSVTGNINGALTLKGKFHIDNMKLVCNHLIESYRSEKSSDKFLWAKSLKIIKDQKTLDVLNETLLKAYQNDTNNTNNTYEIHTDSDKEIDFSKTIFPEIKGLKSLKKQKITLYYFGDTHDLPVSLYKILIFQDDKNIFIAGKWYQIDQNYLTRLNKEITDFQESKISLDFPDYTGEKETKPNRKDGNEQFYQAEATFNRKCAFQKNMLLLDQKSFTVTETNPDGTKIQETIGETCDLYKDKQFIHVKRFDGNANSISHLFTQAVAYSELLKASEIFRSEIKKLVESDNYKNKIIEKLGIATQTTEEIKAFIQNLQNFKANEYTVVLTFLAEKPETHKDISDMKFLCKVGLLEAKRNLENKGFNVKYAWVSKKQATGK